MLLAGEFIAQPVGGSPPARWKSHRPKMGEQEDSQVFFWIFRKSVLGPGVWRMS